MTVAEWVRHAAARLQSAGLDAFRLEAQVLAAHVLNVDRSWVLAHPDESFNDLAGESLLQRREAQEPLAYILGYREFYGRRFLVNSSVLIPRHETETVVEAALNHLPQKGSLLDVGTGSGCIAITVALERPDCGVSAVDISKDALEVARLNAERLGAVVNFLESDLFGSVATTFDVIVSNPPYIGFEEPLESQVVDFEPHSALFASNQGMAIYERIAREAKKHLNTGGFVILELGDGRSGDVVAEFERQGWCNVEIRKDLLGTDRALVVTLS